jgi:GNAT superfamily N-acetyltransferase
VKLKLYFKEISKGTALHIVAFNRDNFEVGFIYGHISKERADIFDTEVIQDYRRKGIGLELHRIFINTAIKRRATQIGASAVKEEIALITKLLGKPTSQTLIVDWMQEGIESNYFDVEFQLPTQLLETTYAKPTKSPTANS